MANVSFQAFLFNRDSITGIGWQREGIDRGGLNFYLPQLIPSFLPSSPFRPPFSSHFRRTRTYTSSKLIRFLRGRGNNYVTQRDTIDNLSLPLFFRSRRVDVLLLLLLLGGEKSRRENENDRRDIVRNETVKYHCPILFT